MNYYLYMELYFNNKFTIMILLLILILLISIIYYFNINIEDNKVNTIENFTDNKKLSKNNSWNRNTCSFSLNKTLKEELDKYNINKDVDNWNLYFPCSYDNPNKEINLMPIKENAKYYIIDNIDYIVAKEKLWENLVNHHGINKAKTIMPMSYILNSDDDIKKFNEDYDPNKIYIMKKNLQRQEGLKITNNKMEILNGKYNNFKLVQELLQNPYTINKRKINLRCYVLVVCNNNKFNVYNYNDGFMYYTPKFFEKGNLDRDVNITTGYIDRKVYQENPLTHNDFKKYLDNDKRVLSNIENNIKQRNLKISNICFDKINDLIKDVFICFVGIICKSQKFKYKNTLFELFGVDIAVDEDLNPMIMEINKGPDMTAKDERDSQVKHNVIRDILRLVKSIDENNENNKFEENGFINIISNDNIYI